MTETLGRDVGSALSAMAAAAAADGPLPGLVACTFADGRLTWQGDVGDTAAQYRIGSITKTFTAVEVLRLRDAGRLELDDPIGRHLPDAPYGDHPVRRLLAHSSGLTAEPAGPWWERSAGRSWPELVEANTPPRPAVVRPGARYHYSNLGYGLLGELVARLRGSSWFEAIQKSLLEPLGLDSTTYHPRTDAAVGTSRNPLTGALVGEPATDTAAMAAAGQLWSTPADLARWGDFLVTGDERILAAATLEEMRTVASADPALQHRSAYGLGLLLHWSAEHTLVGHTGSMPGFLAGLLVDPSTRCGACVLTNATTGLDPATLVAQLIEASRADLPQTPAPAAPGVAPAAIAELAGDWYWGNSARRLEATADGFALVVQGGTRHFVAAGTDRFTGVDGYFTGETLQVVRAADGSVSHLEVVTFILTRTPYDSSAPIPGGPPRELSSPG